VRKGLWRIILTADAILVVVGFVFYGYGRQPIHVAKITSPQAIELKAFTLNLGEQYREELWVELNEPPLTRYDPDPEIVFDYHVSGSIEVYWKEPDGLPRGFLMSDQDSNYGLGTIKIATLNSCSLNFSFSAHTYPLDYAPAQSTILSLRVSSEHYAMRENRLVMTSGLGFGLMMARRSTEAKSPSEFG